MVTNCIFNGHCFEQAQCDGSCPTLAQTSYLLERNGLQMNNPVFHTSKATLDKYSAILAASQGTVKSVIESTSTNTVADILTYCAICDNWKGSQLHCTVYNLKFAQYLENVQKSWSAGSDPSEIDYIKIWIISAKVLIISNLDFINFRDFQCQTLLSLLQSRANPDLTTLIVTPPTSMLVGEGGFFSRLTDLINKQKV